MKLNFVLLLITITLTSCSVSKNKTRGEALKYSEYRSSTFKEKLKKEYQFSENEINTLINLTDKNFTQNSDRKFVLINAVYSNDNAVLNQQNLGLYIFSSSEPYPNFYFLRTENSIVYFRCNEKEKYHDVLMKSVKINDSIKTNIITFISDSCSKGNEMDWMNGRKF